MDEEASFKIFLKDKIINYYKNILNFDEYNDEFLNYVVNNPKSFAIDEDDLL